MGILIPIGTLKICTCSSYVHTHLTSIRRKSHLVFRTARKPEINRQTKSPAQGRAFHQIMCCRLCRFLLAVFVDFFEIGIDNIVMFLGRGCGRLAFAFGSLCGFVHGLTKFH
ncbi:hypothetical protein SAMN05443582_102560 [Phyllobacterium sp. OV277]|nr:hypothetical protein SAMN05443582_102560 [Phyllobacterium sp. OV277]